MQKILFLDRDGVINFEPGHYTFEIDKFTFVKGIFSSLLELTKKGYQFVIITNQGGISKNIYSHNDVEKLHNYMIQKFQENGIDILSIYYCPHHSINENCLCRKPNSLMLEKAIARFNANKETAFFIGDSSRDIEAANNANIKGILIKKNTNLNNILHYFK